MSSLLTFFQIQLAKITQVLGPQAPHAPGTKKPALRDERSN